MGWMIRIRSGLVKFLWNGKEETLFGLGHAMIDLLSIKLLGG